MSNKILESSKLVPPPGARLSAVWIRFQQDRDWQEALNVGAPDTLRNNKVRYIGYLYPSTGTDEIEADLIILNFPNGGSFDKALAWATSNQLEVTAAREVFAISSLHPCLNMQLQQSLMYVVATKECVFGGYRHTCSVWWIGPKLKAEFDPVIGSVDSHAWFAFRWPNFKP